MLELEGDDYDRIVDSKKLKTYLFLLENVDGQNQETLDKIYDLSEEDCYVNFVGSNAFSLELTNKLSFHFCVKENLTAVHVLYKNASCACSWDRMDFLLEEFLKFLKLRNSLFGRKPELIRPYLQTISQNKYFDRS